MSSKPEGLAAAEGDAFDTWLRRSLSMAFDAILAEPVPEDLRRLIEEDRPERERIRQRRADGVPSAAARRGA